MITFFIQEKINTDRVKKQEREITFQEFTQFAIMLTSFSILYYKFIGNLSKITKQLPLSLSFLPNKTTDFVRK